MNCRHHQACSAHSQRMAERDRSTVGIYVYRVIRDSQLPQTRKCLTGERLVQLDEIKIVDG